ncbi:hypothetical protein T06_3657 [Trichinella sp. T6]|nr:hypothetical protein T06_3657 [Trichinella sp. T6]
MMLKKFLNSILHCCFITRNMELILNNQVQAFCNTKKHYKELLKNDHLIEHNHVKIKIQDFLTFLTMLLRFGWKANKYACTDDATASLSCD